MFLWKHELSQSPAHHTTYHTDDLTRILTLQTMEEHAEKSPPAPHFETWSDRG